MEIMEAVRKVETQDLEKLLVGIDLVGLGYDLAAAPPKKRPQTSIRHRGYDCQLREIGCLQYLECIHSSTGDLAVAVPGTNERGDWIHNFDIRKGRIFEVPGKWHRGYLSLAYTLTRGIESFHRRGGDCTGTWKPVKVYCHSLGAAVVGQTISMISPGVIDYTPVLFDPPRFCDAEAARWLTQHYPKAQRWTYGTSIVAHVPPECMGYRHAFKTHAVSSAGTVFDEALSIPLEFLRAVGTPGLQAVQHHLLRELRAQVVRMIDVQRMAKIA